MKTETIDLFKLEENAENPRKITDSKADKLIDSILIFPRMLEIRPIVIDDTFKILGGNMRFKALQAIANMSTSEISANLSKCPGYNDKTELERDTLLNYWVHWINRPVVYVINASELSQKERKEFIIKDNTGFGEWDWSRLSTDWDLSELENWGVDLPADWDTSEAEEQKEAEEDDSSDEDAEKAEPRVKLGEIWQLGEHRLMCGDSTNKEDVARLMNGNMADLVFTDPPYGMKKESQGIINDNLNFNDLLEFNKKWIPLSFKHTKYNGSWYCWGIDEPLMDIYSEILKPLIKQNKITFRNLITWNKGNGQGQKSKGVRMYPIADEKCLFVMCGEWKKEGIETKSWVRPIVDKINAKASIYGLTPKDINKKIGLKGNFNHFTSESVFRFPRIEHWITIFGEESESEYFKLKEEYEYLKNKRESERAYFDNQHDNMNNVWHFSRTSKEERNGTDGHATPKPIALCGRAIKSSSRENELVLDLFGGSGSTLIACEQLNRKCYMMELDPHYCDVIISRWEKLTGKEAVKVHG